jgi:hypothetical protein
VEQQLQQSTEITKLVDIGILEEYSSFDGSSLFPAFKFTKKNGTIRVFTDSRKLSILLKHCMSIISTTKIIGMFCSMEGFTFATELDFNMGYYQIKLDADAQIFPRKIQIQTQIQMFTHGYQDFQFPDIFEMSCLSLSEI